MCQALRLWAILLLALALGSSVRAELHFSQPTIDAGEVRRGPSLVRRFEFTNTGNQTIQITEAKASCGCMIPRLSSKSIAPGEAGWLELTVNTLTQPAGPNTWSVRLQYQEGEKTAEVLTQLRSQLVAEITIEPAAVMMTTDESIRSEIRIRDDRRKPFQIKTIQASSPHVKVPFRFDESVGGCWTAWIEVAAECPEGRHEETVSIYTDDPAYAELKIPLTIVKRGKQRVCATPGAVVLQASADQELPGRIVLLRDANDQALAIDRVWADDPAILTKWVPGPGVMATLKVQVDRKILGNKELRSTVHVEVREPVRQTLDIPVECHAK